MECSEVRRDIQSWLDRTLDEQQAAAFQAHLDCCPECRMTAEQWAGFAAELGGLALWQEPRSLASSVMTSLTSVEEETEAPVVPLILFGLFGLCVFLLLRTSGRLIQLAGNVEALHTPYGIGFVWIAVGLTFAGCLSYLVLHKRVHAKYL